MANSRIIQELKEADSRIASSIRYFVGVPHENLKGKDGSNIGMWGPVAYPPTQDPQIMDKVNFGEMLTGTQVQPTVQVTDEDVQVMKDKAWMAQLMDFNNWVGTVFEPEKSPANKELLSRVYPEWIQMQKDEIDNWHDMKKRIETIKLKGADNKEDLFLMYRLGWPNTDGATIYDPFLSEALSTQNAPGLQRFNEGWRQGTSPALNFQRGIGNSRKKVLQTQALASGPMAYRTATTTNQDIAKDIGIHLMGNQIGKNVLTARDPSRLNYK